MPTEPPPWLQLHLEPTEPIEVSDLTGALSGLARQYDFFTKRRGMPPAAERAALLISSVSPGSIDINFVQDIGAVIAPFFHELTSAHEFAIHLTWLFSLFRESKEDASGPDVSVRDCEDVVAIVKPIAHHGGTQTFNTFNGTVAQVVLRIDASEARSLLENASHQKALLQQVTPERMERVSMVWKRLDRDPAKTKGTTPDKALIEEIDPKPKAVHFTDDMAYLKREMIQDDENPYQKVYFVDVEVSRVAGQVAAYRIVGYHGKDDLEPDVHPALF